MTAETTALTNELHAANTKLDQVLDRFDTLQAQHNDERRRSRRHRAGSAVLAALVVAVIFLGYSDTRQRVEDERQACEQANATRADIRAGILETVLVIVTETDQPDPFVGSLIDGIQDRLAVTIPDREC